MNLKQISLLGCGWLGLPLAKSLVSSGYKVKGSVRREDKLEALTTASIQAYLLEMGNQITTGDLTGFLQDSSVLIISIPPGLRKDPSENYFAKIQSLLPYIQKSGIKKVLFISSTSVYSDDSSIVTEETLANPTTESGKQLLMVEDMLQSNPLFQTSIVRFGGLIGPDRHPINWLSGAKELQNPDAPVNLIHLDDCLGIISGIIEQEKWGEIFNGVAPFHPTREEYYNGIARSKNIPLPVFNHTIPSGGKTVSSQKIQDALKYRFIHEKHLE